MKQLTINTWFDPVSSASPAHRLVRAVFNVQGKPPYSDEALRQSVLRKLPLGTTEVEIAAFLEKNGIHNSEWAPERGGPWYVRSDQDHSPPGVEPKRLICFAQPRYCTYRYQIYFFIGPDGRMTNVTAAGISSWGEL